MSRIARIFSKAVSAAFFFVVFHGMIAHTPA